MYTPELLTNKSGPWNVDPDTLVRLRIARAESELQEGRLGSALVEAEELLTRHPHHSAALRVVAGVALRMGDAALAAETYSQLLEGNGEDPTLISGLAVAQFGLGLLEDSEKLARSALKIDEDNAQSWYCLALVLERTHQSDEANHAFRVANTMDSKLYPLPTRLEPGLLEQSLIEAQARLQPVVKRFYAMVDIRWEEFPSGTELRATTPPMSPFVEALYEGEPPISGDPWTQMPTSVRVFSGNLAWGETEFESLVARIQNALTREAQHWLGITPELSDEE